jgi:probable F420-dependent oxidoreductase
MKLGMNIRNWGIHATPDFLTACAQSADNSSLDAIWFNDHVGLPPVLDDNPYGIPADMGPIIDPLAFGNFLAAVTRRIAFGTAVLIIPYRPPLITNKLIASIQVLSGNRFLLGVGPGYLEEEFRALGVPKSRRGQITDDTLAFLRASADSLVVEVNGQPIELNPALPMPPVYVGGSAEIAIPRALALGDGWIPAGKPPEDLQAPITELQNRARDNGRGDMEVIAMKTLPLEDTNAAIDLACAYRDVGVTHLVHTQGYDSTAQYAEVVAQIDGPIRAALGA